MHPPLQGLSYCPPQGYCIAPGSWYSIVACRGGRPGHGAPGEIGRGTARWRSRSAGVLDRPGCGPSIYRWRPRPGRHSRGPGSAWMGTCVRPAPRGPGLAVSVSFWSPSDVRRCFVDVPSVVRRCPSPGGLPLVGFSPMLRPLPRGLPNRRSLRRCFVQARPLGPRDQQETGPTARARCGGRGRGPPGAPAS